MKIEMSSYSPIFGETSVSDLFFTRYLPSMDAECVKIYLYILYLAGKNMAITPDDLAAEIGYSKDTIGTKLIELQQIGLLSFYTDRIIVTNLAADELEKSYRPKTTGDPEDLVRENKKFEDKYKKAIKAVNDRFFNGSMATGWYQDIMLWVDKYSFEPETLFLLFQHCKDSLKKTPVRSYVAKVAENWGAKGVRTPEQVEKLLENKEEFLQYKKSIQKKLKMRDITVFQEAIIDKWFYDYKFPLEIVDLALSKSVKKLNVSLPYFDAILTDWHNKGLSDISEIEIYEQEHEEQVAKDKPNLKPLPSKPWNNTKQTRSVNYNERKYDEDFLNSFVGGGDDD